LDRDLADQIESAHVLIWAAVSRSGGQGRRARGAAAQVAGDGIPAAAHGWGSPDRAKLGRPGTKSSAAWL